MSYSVLKATSVDCKNLVSRPLVARSNPGDFVRFCEGLSVAPKWDNFYYCRHSGTVVFGIMILLLWVVRGECHFRLVEVEGV